MHLCLCNLACENYENNFNNLIIQTKRERESQIYFKEYANWMRENR